MTDNNTSSRDDVNLCCSFCGESQKNIRQLIAGPSCYICNECIMLCSQIVADSEKNFSKKNIMGMINSATDLLYKLRETIDRIPPDFFSLAEPFESRGATPNFIRQVLIDEIMSSCVDGCPPLEQKSNVVVLIKYLESVKLNLKSVKIYLNDILGLKTFGGKPWTVKEIKRLALPLR